METLRALLPVLVCLGLIFASWGAVRLYHRVRPPKAVDQRTPEWVKVFLILLVVWLVVEIVSIQTLGKNANDVFQRVPPQTQESK